MYTWPLSFDSCWNVVFSSATTPNGDEVLEDNNWWLVFLTIMDYVFAPLTIILYVRHLIATHHCRFRELYPDCSHWLQNSITWYTYLSGWKSNCCIYITISYYIYSVHYFMVALNVHNFLLYIHLKLLFRLWSHDKILVHEIWGNFKDLA